MNVPFVYSYVREMRAPTNPGGALTPRYRGRCVCGWTTNMHYSTPAMALGAARMTHNETSGAHESER